MLKITIKSMDAANRVLLRSSIDFIKITAQRAYLPLRNDVVVQLGYRRLAVA